jgi:hypothetical protein
MAYWEGKSVQVDGFYATKTQIMFAGYASWCHCTNVYNTTAWLTSRLKRDFPASEASMTWMSVLFVYITFISKTEPHEMWNSVKTVTETRIKLKYSDRLVHTELVSVYLAMTQH